MTVGGLTDWGETDKILKYFLSNNWWGELNVKLHKPTYWTQAI